MILEQRRTLKGERENAAGQQLSSGIGRMVGTERRDNTYELIAVVRCNSTPVSIGSGESTHHITETLGSKDFWILNILDL